jgi:hypothetical protein
MPLVEILDGPPEWAGAQFASPEKLWGSAVRVYAAPPGTPRPDPACAPEEQGWQELTRGGMLRRPRAPGTSAFYQERLARQLAEGNPWVVDHWRRLADREGRPRTPRST